MRTGALYAHAVPFSIRSAAAGVTAAIGIFALTLSACDTGDGKQLHPVDPRVTTIATPPPATDGGTGVLPASTLQPNLETGFEVFAPWLNGAPIDSRYTCSGLDVAPALSWKSPPPGTEQLAFALVDESATDSGGRPLVHWILAAVETTNVTVAEGVVPPGAIQATNSFDKVGWTGPCPPVGAAPHTYRLTMYALNQQVELADGTPANELLDYIESVSIASTELTGTYQR
jgi:Raf kinase inhibitor-like YbhB/YbcL family protein